tara:strand:- start:39 stop:701 length:663 start_codon:yes stop_codon:yes gene_type:complete
MNNHLITKLVKYILYGLVAVSFTNIFSNMAQIDLLNDYFVGASLSEDTFNILAVKNFSRVAFVNAVFSILIFSSYILIGRWFYVSAKINHLLGIKELNITPGWAIGWYFIPFANLVMPYRSLKETYKASFNSEDWQSTKIPYDFPIWWLTYLVGNALSTHSLRLSLRLGEEYTYQQLNQISYFDIGADTLLIINAFFLLRIVNTIFNNQKDKNFKQSLVT